MTPEVVSYFPVASLYYKGSLFPPYLKALCKHSYPLLLSLAGILFMYPHQCLAAYVFKSTGGREVGGLFCPQGDIWQSL